MSQIIVDPEEYADIVMIFLLESIRNDLLTDNKQFDEFITKLEKGGFKQHLFKTYMEIDSNTRIKYKRIKRVFDDGPSARIEITGSVKTKNIKTGKVTTKRIGSKERNTVLDKGIKKLVSTAKRSVGLKESDEVYESDFDRDLCKRIFRKVKEVRFKTSKPITEERLDKIIDYCIKEKEEQNNG
jgi:hypothetical protein